jgi:pimeloyl-ACP methyl ester carboxylesterase
MSIPLRFSTWRASGGGARTAAGAAARWAVTALDGYEVHSVEYGERGAEPVVLLHGLSGSSRWWRRNATALAEERHVVVPDLIGFGRSRWRGALPDVRTVAGLLARWIEERDMERAHVVGHSMGGQIAIHLAAGYPELLDRLVLVDAAGIPRPLTPVNLVRFAAEIAPAWRWGDPLFLPTIAGDALAAGPRVLAQAIGHILRDDVRPLLPRIQAPTLVVWGERDYWVPLSHGWEMREGIPGSRLAVLRRAGHNPMVDRPGDFNDIVLRFLGGETVGL